MTFDQAATIPAAAGTAVLAFYNQPGTPFGGLGLTAPWDGGRGKYMGEPIVIVGGSSAVGQYGMIGHTLPTTRILTPPRDQLSSLP